MSAAEVRVPGPRRSGSTMGRVPWARPSRAGLVPEQAVPPPVRGPGRPLALGRDTRARLGAAVRALLALDGLDGALDPVRLAAVVLAAKTSVDSGVVEIRTRELGRWLGLSESRTASFVIPALRGSGVVEIDTLEGEFGEDRGLVCRVVPLRKARRMIGHPLSLSRKELATLLRLVEAVMAPGWSHRDGSVTAAGLLGERTGRSAATDRLALLLLALEAGESGRVRLCGSTVNTKYGRPVATAARLLGCSVHVAAGVLGRLESAGLVERCRVRTASGMAHRSRLVVPAVAAAHRPSRAAVVQDERGGTAHPECSEPGVTAGHSEDSLRPEKPQVTSASGAVATGVVDPEVAAALHTDHVSVAEGAVDGAASKGFSGEGRRGFCGQPERACMREDQASKADPVDQAQPFDGEGVPLRGERKESPVDEQGGQRAAGAAAGARLKAMPSGKALQLRRVGLPKDLDLRVVLAPVAGLWQRLNGWQQDKVERTAAVELGRLASLLMQPEAAPRLLADRLTDRLEETSGEPQVNSPFGWLTRRGLVQRMTCPDARCDDGIRLDTGGECDNCSNVIHFRRARRARIAAEVDAQLPSLGDLERRKVIEDRLREHAAAEAEHFVRRREQASAEQARRAATRAEAQERMEREQTAALAAEAARQALPCADCGQTWAARLCEACGYWRRTEALISEAGMIAATATAAPDDAEAVAAVATRVRMSLQADIAAARAKFLALMEPGELAAEPEAERAAHAFTGLHAVQQAVPEYRRYALAMLGRTEEAEAEARRAYTAEQNRRWFRANPTGADAVAAATKAADTARERTAQYLLAVRLEQLREQVADRTETVAPAPWSNRLPELASRRLDGGTARAVIA